MNDAAVKIAVTSRIFRGREDGRGAQREATIAMSLALSDAVADAGAWAWLLPPLDDRTDEMLDDIVASHQGLILQGGPDIAPEIYRANASQRSEQAERDRREIDLLRRFIQSRKPVLGICRGCQLINVAFGGTLYEDLPSEHGAATLHSDPARYVGLEHTVDLSVGGYLNRLYGVTRGMVNSAHRQGVCRLGNDLHAVALAPDGLIEGFRWRGSSYVVGLQWHPEFYARDSRCLPGAPLFEDFVREASAFCPGSTDVHQ